MYDIFLILISNLTDPFRIPTILELDKVFVLRNYTNRSLIFQKVIKYYKIELLSFRKVKNCKINNVFGQTLSLNN